MAVNMQTAAQPRNSSDKLHWLLTLLSDGKFHSGQSIAENLAISRSAVWKLMQKLQQWGLNIYSVTGKGYQLAGGLELINQNTLQQFVRQQNCLFQSVKVLLQVDSTARQVEKIYQQQPGVGCLCVAEYQTAGKGRKASNWVSPFAQNFYFSIAVELPFGLSALGGLSLAIAIGFCQALNQLTSQPSKVKWPNDIWLDDKKLAGILLEASGDNSDCSLLNIGIGINWQMQAEKASDIKQPWTNLKPWLKQPMSRNAALMTILQAIDDTLKTYIKKGFAHFHPLWSEYSYLYRKPVCLVKTTGAHTRQLVNGIETGIQMTGALEVQTDKGIESFYSGEVSLRSQHAQHVQQTQQQERRV